jgi:hypothetical protein
VIRPAFGLHHELNVERGNAPMKTMHVPTSRDRGVCSGGDVPASMAAGRLARVLQLCLAVVAALMVVAVAVPVASAAPLGVLGASGSTGTGDGQFQGTGGVAVRESTGDVYVIDVGGNRVQRFNAVGEFQGAFGTSGTGDGQFDFSGGRTFQNPTPQLAVDQSDGSVYVADNGNARIQKFSAGGAFELKFGGLGSGDGEFSQPRGVAVGPTDGSVYVADTGNYRVQKFSSAGTYVSQFGSQGDGDGQFLEPFVGDPVGVGTGSGAIRVAVDAVGRVYVLDYSRRVQRFTAAGTFDAVIDTSAVSFITELAADPAGDHVFVGDYYGKIAELEGAGTLVDVHPSTSSLSAGTLTGLGVRAGGLAYAAAQDGYDGSLNSRLFRFGAVTPSTVSLQPLTAIEGRSATVNATINPNGAPVAGYQIEVSADGGGTFTRQPRVPVAVGSGTTEVEIHETVTDLIPNNFYLYRVIVTRAYNEEVASNYDFFSTLPVAPTITGTRATPTEISAMLRAEVNPESVATTYHFEYGTTDAYGRTLPTTPASVGEGRTPVTVVKTVADLDAATSYHYRIVAENSAGVTYGPDRTFTTRTPEPPESGEETNGRAIEQVSPVEKNGFSVNQALNVQSSETGDAVSFGSDGALPGAASGLNAGRYIVRRSAAGWTTRPIEAPQQASINKEGGVGGATFFLSQDLSIAVQYSALALAPGAVDQGTNIYRNDTASGARTLAVAAPGDDGVGSLYANNFWGTLASYAKFVTPDAKTIVMHARDAKLVPDAPTGAITNLFEFTGGQTRLVNRFPDGTPMPNGGRTGGRFANSHAVSDDGRRIFFQGQPRPDTVQLFPDAAYMRVDGTTTKALSVSRVPGASADPQVAQLWGATADGSVVYFSSPYGLNPGDPTSPNLYNGSDNNLYRYDVNSDTLTTVRSNVPDSSSAAMSEDGSRIYFEDAVDVDGPNGTEQRNRLVTWAGGTLDVVAEVDAALGPIGSDLRSFAPKLSVSPNGRYLAFDTAQKLKGFDTFGRQQVFVYDAISKQTVCASCRDETDGVAGLWRSGNSIARVSNHPVGEVLDNGQVFFTTATALDRRRDVNGAKDVYAWEGGATTLISPGTGPQGAQFGDSSSGGRDVFFTTADRLVAQDTDGLYDLYDARVGGGLPEQNVVPAGQASPCAGETCQGTPSLRPGQPSAGSVTFTGTVDPAAPTRKRVGKVKVSVVKTIRGASGQLRVVVPAAGKITVTGASIRRASRRAPGPRSVGLPVVLTNHAQRTLRKGGSVRARVTVTFKPWSATRHRGASRSRSSGRRPPQRARPRSPRPRRRPARGRARCRPNAPGPPRTETGSPWLQRRQFASGSRWSRSRSSASRAPRSPSSASVRSVGRRLTTTATR